MPKTEKPGALTVTLNRASLYLKASTIVPAVLITALIYAFASRNRPIVTAITGYITSQLYKTYSNHPALYETLKNRLYKLSKSIPAVKKILDKDLQPAIEALENDMFKEREGAFRFTHLPLSPIDVDTLLLHLDEATEIKGGPDAMTKQSGALYTLKHQLHREIYKRTTLINAMHTTAWPKVQDLENQAVQMCLELYHAPEEACGKLTGGGSISIFEALFAYKQQALDRLLPTTQPNIVIPDRAHPAFKKACRYFNIQVKEVKTDPESLKVDLKAMEKAIDPNTIVLIASMPAFPEGVWDDTDKVAALASKYGIGCHIDCCLGGFLVPFCEDLGIKTPDFDFRVPGITSISADVHKFGEAEKGQSFVMYRDTDLFEYSTFTDLLSKIGVYASGGIEGSRPPRVNAWATMLSIGREGYVENLRQMLAIKDKIVSAVEAFDCIEVHGKPKLPIIAFRAVDKIDILLVASQMKERGWNVNGLPTPAFHFCITSAHITKDSMAFDFITDLKSSIQYALDHPKEKPSGQLGMYDTIRYKIPPSLNTTICNEIAHKYLTALYSANRRFTQKSQGVPVYSSGRQRPSEEGLRRRKPSSSR